MDCDCPEPEKTCSHDGKPCDPRCRPGACYRHCSNPDDMAKLLREHRGDSEIPIPVHTTLEIRHGLVMCREGWCKAEDVAQMLKENVKRVAPPEIGQPATEEGN